MGVRPSRAVPREEFWNHHISMGGAHGCPHALCGAQPGAGECRQLLQEASKPGPSALRWLAYLSGGKLWAVSVPVRDLQAVTSHSALCLPAPLHSSWKNTQCYKCQNPLRPGEPAGWQEERPCQCLSIAQHPPRGQVSFCAMAPLEPNWWNAVWSWATAGSGTGAKTSVPASSPLLTPHSSACHSLATAPAPSPPEASPSAL